MAALWALFGAVLMIFLLCGMHILLDVLEDKIDK
mgnify:FL=1|jgi:hypothetical protein